MDTKIMLSATCNMVGLPSYPSLYDKFLLAVSLGFNVVTIWYAWKGSQYPAA